jgi:hypothetical protein
MKMIHEGKVIHIRVTEKRVNDNITRLSDEITSLMDDDGPIVSQLVNIERIRWHLDMMEFWLDTLSNSEHKNNPLFCLEGGCEYDEEE